MILNIILASLLSIFVLISGFFGIRLVKLGNRIQEFEIRASLLEQGFKKTLEKTSPAIENSEGFLRFVSESRDWAFEYIEEVQKVLNEFVSEVDPLIEYFDKYGDSVGMVPNYEAMKHISSEFKKLKNLLPKDE